MSRLSHQPSDPAYYIEDCRILLIYVSKKFFLWNWVCLFIIMYLNKNIDIRATMYMNWKVYDIKNA